MNQTHAPYLSPAPLFLPTLILGPSSAIGTMPSRHHLPYPVLLRPQKPPIKNQRVPSTEEHFRGLKPAICQPVPARHFPLPGPATPKVYKYTYALPEILFGE
jgi:hypothetical protein